MWVFDVESLAFLDVNDATMATYGWSRDEFLRMTLVDLRSVEARSDFLETIPAQLAADGPWRGNGLHHVTRGGRRLDVNVCSVPTVYNGRPARLAMVEEVTSEAAAREEARRAEERWRALSQHWPGYLMCVDAADRLTWLNRDTLRVSATRDLGRSIYDFVAPEEVAATRALFDETRATGCAVTRQNCLSVEGVLRYYESQCIPLGTEVLLAVTEVTSAVRAAQAVAKSERHFRALIEKSAEGISLTDKNGKTVYVSPAGSKLLGVPSSPRGQAAQIHPEDRDAVTESLAWVRAHPGEGRTVEYRARRGEGEWRSVESTETNLLDDPAVEAIVGNFRDVTERNRLGEQFLHAQKMEAVGRLAGGIAHDFNNVLSVIMSYADMIIGDLSPDEPIRADMIEIRAAGQRAADLTRQLLAFSRQQVLQPKSLDLNESVSKMKKILHRLLGEDIALAIVPASGIYAVKADPGQIEQIVMNLAVNARDAMPQGGTLTVETANVDLEESDARTHPGGVASGSYVMLAVTDTGTGMDRKTQARIFEPFFTTKEKGKGTGLGLSTVFGIVKQSGGHIWVESEPGKGATFKVYFPRSKGAAVVRPSEGPGPASERGNETILLVEDDDQVRTLARNILRRSGYTVLEAPNGGEALLVCEQHATTIHLLLTDVVLPRMSGRLLAERLVAMRPAMKVLFMSGYTDDAILHHRVLDSGVAFLQKPLTPDSLASSVRAVLQGGLKEEATHDARG